jgi:hypothetical protein
MRRIFHQAQVTKASEAQKLTPAEDPKHPYLPAARKAAAALVAVLDGELDVTIGALIPDEGEPFVHEISVRVAVLPPVEEETSVEEQRLSQIAHEGARAALADLGY